MKDLDFTITKEQEAKLSHTAKEAAAAMGVGEDEARALIERAIGHPESFRKLQNLTNELMKQRDPDKELKGIQLAHVRKRVGRNSPCECGSGKKFKNCCYRKDRTIGVIAHTKLMPLDGQARKEANEYVKRANRRYRPRRKRR